jgi:hypothetical protein
MLSSKNVYLGSRPCCGGALKRPLGLIAKHYLPNLTSGSSSAKYTVRHSRGQLTAPLESMYLPSIDHFATGKVTTPL